MSIYSTKIKANKADQAEFTNPFTNQVYKRGELNVKVNSKELVGERAMAIMKRQTDSIISTTHPDFPAIIDPTQATSPSTMMHSCSFVNLSSDIPIPLLFWC